MPHEHAENLAGTPQTLSPPEDLFRQKLVAALQEDLPARRFTLEYQPQISLISKQIVRFEALIRWRHPTMGEIAPKDFVPLAEEMGMIGEIGQWVLEQACVDAMQWPAAIGLAVNVSATRMHDLALPSIVQSALQQSGLPASRLELEITETAAIALDAQSFRTLDALRALGVRITIDDLDVGHSSFRYLLDFPFDKIKVDGSYTALLGQSGRRGESALAIVRTIAGLCHRLNICALVEGVETAEQLALVMGANYTEVQGYLFSRPVTADKIASLGSVIANVWERLAFPVQVAAAAGFSFFQVADASSDIIIVTTADLTPPGPQIVYVNPAFTRLTGYSAEEAIGRTPRMLQGPGTSRETLNAIRTTLNEGRAIRETVLNFAKHGAPYWLDIRIEPLRDAVGTLSHFVAIQRDVTLGKRRLDELEYVADRDILTGIPNRRAFLRTVEAELSARPNPGDFTAANALCLAWIHVDYFDKINDAFGHETGDSVLFELAGRLTENIRRIDTIGRLGGVKFAVCMPGISLASAQSLCERLHHSVSAAVIETDAGPVNATVSIGVVSRAPMESLARLMERADAAMVQAKKAGGNQIRPQPG